MLGYCNPLYLLDPIHQIPQPGTLQHVLSRHPLAPISGSGFFLAYPAAFIQYVLVYCYNQGLILESWISPTFNQQPTWTLSSHNGYASRSPLCSWCIRVLGMPQEKASEGENALRLLWNSIQVCHTVYP
jgi:hypothetical protein